MSYTDKVSTLHKTIFSMYMDKGLINYETFSSYKNELIKIEKVANILDTIYSNRVLTTLLGNRKTVVDAKNALDDLCVLFEGACLGNRRSNNE